MNTLELFLHLQSLQGKFQGSVQGTDVGLNIAGIQKIKDLKTETVPLKIKGLHKKNIQPRHLHKRKSRQSETQTTTKRSWSKVLTIEIFLQKNLNLKKGGILLGQEAYVLQPQC